MGDMARQSSRAPSPKSADIRIVAVAGTSQQQCNIFLVKKDAPEFKSAEEALHWFDGKGRRLRRKAAAPTASPARCFRRWR